MQLRHLFEAKARNVIAIMPGGFHPFHPGHKSLYDWAVKTFGQKNVYVAATNDQETRPFPFEVKKKLAAMAGVPESNFMQVRSPFNNREYSHLLDDDTALVFVRSEKDKNEEPLPDRMKIDKKTKKPTNEPRYLRSYTGKDLNTHDEMGYMAYGPTINFDFSGMSIKSASELRAAWPKMSDEDKLKAAKLMYGNGAPVAVKLLDQALGGTNEDVSPEDEDKFHNELDDLVHKYFGDSPDEEKMKKKMKKVKEGSVSIPAKQLHDMVVEFVKDIEYNDTKTLAKIARVLGKEVFYKNDRVIIQDPDFDFYAKENIDRLAEIFFGTRKQKTTTVTRRRPPEEDSVQDKLKKRRALAKKIGVDQAFKSDALKGK